MLCVPALRVEVEKDADALPFNVDVPNGVEPSRKVIVPDGVPLDPEVTVAVNVTS
jgi:hypothetical protein